MTGKKVETPEVPEQGDVNANSTDPVEDGTGLPVDEQERDAKQAVHSTDRAEESASEDEYVNVEGRDRESAVLLLAAAEELGVGQDVVLTTSEGFRVPRQVHDKAFGKTGSKRPSPGDDN